MIISRLHLPEYYRSIGWVRFHKFDFVDQGVDVAYRIAIINTVPDPVIRDQFFADRGKITNATGWYPLIQGSRAHFFDRPFRQNEAWRKSRTRPDFREFGHLVKLRALANSDDTGNSFLIEGTKANVLLDAGMDCVHDSAQNLSLVFLSHHHRDHSGSIWNLVENTKAPIVSSQVTLNYLYMLDQVDISVREQLAWRTLSPEDIRLIEFGDGGSLRFFPVYHCPGAYGMTITDGGTSLTYFGDLCLANGFRTFQLKREHSSPKAWPVVGYYSMRP